MKERKKKKNLFQFRNPFISANADPSHQSKIIIIIVIKRMSTIYLTYCLFVGHHKPSKLCAVKLIRYEYVDICFVSNFEVFSFLCIILFVERLIPIPSSTPNFGPWISYMFLICWQNHNWLLLSVKMKYICRNFRFDLFIVRVFVKYEVDILICRIQIQWNCLFEFNDVNVWIV